MSTDLCDKHGYAVAYVDDDKQSIYMSDGRPAAWLCENVVYAYNGKLLGWLHEGWIFGRDGKCVLFTATAQRGAIKPFRQAATDRGDQGPRPSRETRDVACRRPGRSLQWASTDALSFFGI